SFIIRAFARPRLPVKLLFTKELVMQARIFLVLAAIAGFSGVALGAFGAHGLKGTLEPHQLVWWNTAVQYHLVHAVVLLGVAAWLQGDRNAAVCRVPRGTRVWKVVGLGVGRGSLV